MNIDANYVALITIVRREVLRFSRIWVQTLTPPAINALLYIIIFGTLIGSQMPEIQGFKYIEYIVPGIIMMSVITNSYSNVVSSFYSAKFQRNIEEMLVAPLSSITMLAGFVLGGVARGLVVGSIVTLVMLLFADIQVKNVLVTLSIVFLTSVVFSIGGLINAVFAKSFDDITIIPNFVLAPLTYFGGVFYSIELLPEGWRSISLFNPVLYMINGFRYGILGVSDIPIEHAFMVILLFIVVFSATALTLLRLGIGIKQ